MEIQDVVEVDTDKKDTNRKDFDQDLIDLANIDTIRQEVKQEELSIDNTGDEVNTCQEINTNKVVTEVEIHEQP